MESMYRRISELLRRKKNNLRARYLRRYVGNDLNDLDSSGVFYGFYVAVRRLDNREVVDGVFSTYNDLYTHFKENKYYLRFLNYSNEVVHYRFPKIKNVFPNNVQLVDISLIDSRRVKLSESWAREMGLENKYPQVNETFQYIWFKDWSESGGYKLEDIKKSFVYKYAWHDRNTVHGIVRDDPLGLWLYALDKWGIVALSRSDKDKLPPLKIVLHGDHRYEIIDGHHRAAALALLGEQKFPAVVSEEVE